MGGSHAAQEPLKSGHVLSPPSHCCEEAHRAAARDNQGGTTGTENLHLLAKLHSRPFCKMSF